MRFINQLAASLLVGCLAVSASAADKPEKGKGKGKENTPTAQLLKQLEGAKLTAEQTAKIKESGAKAQTESDKLLADAGVEKSVLQARAKAGKEARDAGKTPKEAREAAEAALSGLSAAQKDALKASEKVMGKFRKEVWELLTEDQRKGLPEQVRTNLERAATATGKKAA